MTSYAVIFHASTHYYFGGISSYGALDSIFALEENTWTWSKRGSMNSKRYAHGVILLEEKIMVVGGDGKKKNEACVLNNGQFSCTKFTTLLNDYAYYPVLYVLDEDQKNC